MGILLRHQRQDFAEDIAFVLQMTAYAIAWMAPGAIEGLGVNGVEAEDLKVAVL